MQDAFALIPKDDGTNDLYIYYDRALNSEFALDFLYGQPDPARANSFMEAVARRFADEQIAAVKILLGGIVIASMAYQRIQALATQPLVTIGYLYSGTAATQRSYLERTGGAINTAMPSYFDLNTNGTLKLNPVDAQLVTLAHSLGGRVVPFLSNHWDRAVGVAALNNRENLSVAIANAVSQYNLDGVNVDLENLTEAHRDSQTALVARLRQLIPAGKEVSVCVAANPNGYTTGWHGSYDYRGLAQAADYLMMMTYDEHYQGGPVGSVAGLPWVKRSVEFALRYATADKVVLGLPLFGRIWSSDGRFVGHGVTWARVEELIATYNANVVFDPVEQSPRAVFTFTASSPPGSVAGMELRPATYTVWFDNIRSLELKTELVKQYNLRGAGFWALGQENVQLWPQFKNWLNIPPTPGPGEELKPGYVLATSVFMRSGPSTSSSIIGELFLGQRVMAAPAAPGWLKVEAGGRTGYVSADFIQMGDLPAPRPAWVNASSLNVRQFPSTASTILATLPRGTAVTVLATRNDWALISYGNNQQGYAALMFLSFGTPPRTGTVTANVLNVRGAPNTGAPILGTLRQGDQVQILAESNGWYTINFQGRTGYIASQFVATGSQPVGYVTATLLNVRQLPSTTARVIGQLPRGSMVTILSTANGWHYVRFGNGQMGYVSAEFVSNTRP